MSIRGVFREVFSFFDAKPIVVEVSPSQLSSDAGLLPIRQLDELLGLTEPFAAALVDPRCEAGSTHTYLEMTRSGVYGILAGYEDQNDHSALRSDGVFKLLAGRSPDGEDLASQPTLSRFENAIDPRSLLNLLLSPVPARAGGQTANGSSISVGSTTRSSEGHAETWRTRLIKVAAEIIVSARRVWIRLSSWWPFLDHSRTIRRRG